ncbi:transcription factor HES-4-A-like isoform X1 [Centruroides vittatus]|uniref:transcription factor HES-4-A-like isoform X1 n=2 Tax=Centruroides vittatus TaxID=120091 RepID=UPI00350EE1C9
MTLPAEKPLGLGIRPSENRRASKPLMEKKRRARINKSLCELKSLILDTVKQETQNPRHSKLEKADILEMAVRHLQTLQGQDKKDIYTSKFRAGFEECTREVDRYFSEDPKVDPSLKSRLLTHLGGCLSSLRPEEEEAKPEVETKRDDPKVVPLIVSRLPNGQLALVMPEKCQCLPVINLPLDLSNRPKEFVGPLCHPDPKLPHRLGSDEVWRPW